MYTYDYIIVKNGRQFSVIFMCSKHCGRSIGYIPQAKGLCSSVKHGEGLNVGKIIYNKWWICHCHV